MSIALSDEAELQVQGYLRFANLKREQHVREVVSTISDFKSSRIREGEMYNFRELLALFSELEQEARQLIEKEIQDAYHTNALLVKLLLGQAQAAGVELAVDTNQLENEFLLKQISSSEATALSRPASDFIRRNTTLGRLGTVAQVKSQDPALIRERDELKAELAAAKERMAKLQEETTKMMRDRSALNQQLNSLRDEVAAKDAALAGAQGDRAAALAALQRDLAHLSTAATGSSGLSVAAVEELHRREEGLSGQVASLQEELQAARNQVALQEKELRAASEAAAGKLADSKQFTQMKALMQAKSQEVAALRKRLEKYEPHNVPSADTA